MRLVQHREHRACPIELTCLATPPPRLAPSRSSSRSLAFLSARPEHDSHYCSSCWILIGGYIA
eukprot:9488303-Pyramimonas_sp.AAC.1